MESLKKMLKTIFTGYLLIAAINFTALLILLVICFASDVLTTKKSENIIKLLRGAKLAEEMEAKPKDLLEWEREMNKRKKEQDKNQELQQKQIEDLTLRFRSEKKLVEKLKSDVETMVDKFDKDKKKFDEIKNAEIKQLQDKGFKRTVSIFEQMDATDVASAIEKLEEKVQVLYLKTFKPTFSAEILQAYTDQKNKRKILEMLRKGEPTTKKLTGIRGSRE